MSAAGSDDHHVVRELRKAGPGVDAAGLGVGGQRRGGDAVRAGHRGGGPRPAGQADARDGAALREVDGAVEDGDAVRRLLLGEPDGHGRRGAARRILDLHHGGGALRGVEHRRRRAVGAGRERHAGGAVVAQRDEPGRGVDPAGLLVPVQAPDRAEVGLTVARVEVRRLGVEDEAHAVDRPVVRRVGLSVAAVEVLEQGLLPALDAAHPEHLVGDPTRAVGRLDDGGRGGEPRAAGDDLVGRGERRGSGGERAGGGGRRDERQGAARATGAGGGGHRSQEVGERAHKTCCARDRRGAGTDTARTCGSIAPGSSQSSRTAGSGSCSAQAPTSSARSSAVR